MENQCHILAFGLIADVQYADMDDGTNFAQTRRRYYRAALESLERAVVAWKATSRLTFVVQLGDLLDGLNRHVKGPEAAALALRTVLAPFMDLPCPTYHMVGNHDLYNLTRREIAASELNSGRLAAASSPAGQLYYSVLVHPCLRLIVLDTYDVSVLGYADDPNHPHYQQGQRLLEENNPNPEKNSALGLVGEARRFVAYNGGIGREQLAWLKVQLTEADAVRQNILICAHCQLAFAPNHTADVGTCLVWNHAEVLAILHSHSCVIGCIMGHDHDGSLTIDSAGIPHLVLNGVIETPPGTDTYATAFLTKTALKIHGAGVAPSTSFPLRYCIDTPCEQTLGSQLQELCVA